MIPWAHRSSTSKFAGPTAEKAVVGPEAQAVLTAYDEFATHYQIVYRTDVAENPAQK